ncbi:MAG TPA: Tim44-like domain-containing protein [Burkholderiales bacterium]|nr:Tim44-like domain-containing protein [Burkholderiales bacterium]
MRKWLFALFAFVFVAGLVPFDAEARRFGGGRSIGTQRQAVPDKPVTPPAAAPTQQAAPAAAGAAAAPKPGMGRWLAPLAGLAAGLGLAYLLGDQLGTFVAALLIGIVLVAAVMLLMRLFVKPRQQAAPQGMRYAGIGNETVAAPPPSQATGVAAEPSFRAQFARRIPDGFNTDAFVREAKKSFIALQAANDRGDAGAIRDFVTDEMFQHLKADLEARGATGQQTDVVTLNAELLEVVTEGDMHWASVRFSGLLREESGGAPQSFAEVWNLQKAAKGDSGWLLAGIQQLS